MRRYCYLAGPITGLTYDEATDWREKIAFDVECAGFHPLSPMRGKERFKDYGKILPGTFDEEQAAVQRDLYDIRRAHVVLINLLDAKRVSIGTMCELGYAHALGKFIIVALPKVETLTDNKGREYKHGYYVHEHLFVRELASQVVDSLDAALDTLERL